MTDAEFMQSLADCTLPNLDHRSHIRAAWITLQQKPLAEAIVDLSGQFQNYAESKGHPDYFHATVTWGFMIAIHERMYAGKAGQSWEEFLKLNPDLDVGISFLHQWYPPVELQSDRARKCPIMPAPVSPEV